MLGVWGAQVWLKGEGALRAQVCWGAEEQQAWSGVLVGGQVSQAQAGNKDMKSRTDKVKLL